MREGLSGYVKLKKHPEAVVETGPPSRASGRRPVAEGFSPSLTRMLISFSLPNPQLMTHEEDKSIPI